MVPKGLLSSDHATQNWELRCRELEEDALPTFNREGGGAESAKESDATFFIGRARA
jgi:hypothetical protein